MRKLIYFHSDDISEMLSVCILFNAFLDFAVQSDLYLKIRETRVTHELHFFVLYFVRAI